MTHENNSKLKPLIQGLPSGLLADSAWLGRKGYYHSLRSRYVNGGWLERPAQGVYRMPGGGIQWQHVLISLQSIMEFPIVAGGVTAMHVHGYTHYVPYRHLPYACLYGASKPSSWLFKLPCETRFRYHGTHRLFPDTPVVPASMDVDEWIGLDTDDAVSARHAKIARESKTQTSEDAAFVAASFTRKTWGMWDWPMVVSTPERAVLETIDVLPQWEGCFDLVDKFLESVFPDDLNALHMNTLLKRCNSIKTKRMFMWFAERHGFDCLDAIDIDAIDLGSGKRQIFKGGRLHTNYNITMPLEADDGF